MAQCWEEELAWTCPPVYMVSEVVRKISHTRMMAILVVPAWTTAPFWPTVFPNGTHAVTICTNIKLIRPHIVRGKFCQNKVMQGHTAFPFLALYLRSRGEGYQHVSGSVMCPSVK